MEGERKIGRCCVACLEGSLEKLEKTRKEILLQSPQEEASAAEALIVGLLTCRL